MLADDFAIVLADSAGGAVNAVLNGKQIRCFVESVKNEELAVVDGVSLEMVRVFGSASDMGAIIPGQMVTFNGQKWQVMRSFGSDGVAEVVLGRNYS